VTVPASRDEAASGGGFPWLAVLVGGGAGLIVLLVAGLIFGLTLSKGGPTPAPPAVAGPPITPAPPAVAGAPIKPAGEEKPPPLAIRANDLHAAYAANEVAADRQYRARWLDVTGTVQDIKRDPSGAAVVELQSGEKYWPVRCKFARQDEDAVAGLAKGRVVTVRGLCAGRWIQYVRTDSASFSQGVL
jgi:hypothetical protein